MFFFSLKKLALQGQKKKKKKKKKNPQKEATNTYKCKKVIRIPILYHNCVKDVESSVWMNFLWSEKYLVILFMSY